MCWGGSVMAREGNSSIRYLGAGGAAEGACQAAPQLGLTETKLAETALHEAGQTHTQATIRPTAECTPAARQATRPQQYSNPLTPMATALLLRPLVSPLLFEETGLAVLRVETLPALLLLLATVACLG